MKPGEPADMEGVLRLRFKAELRKSLQRQRVVMPAGTRQAKSEAIRERVRGLGLLERVRSVALFRSIERKGEVDTTGIDHDARRLGLRVAYPMLDVTTDDPSGAVVRAAMSMRWVDLSEGLEGAFEERGFGFPEPHGDAPVAQPDELDLVLVPGLAFDPLGCRIGYGKGFYDRYLPLCTRATAIGVCFDLQIVAEVPSMPGDVPVSMVLTESRSFSR